MTGRSPVPRGGARDALTAAAAELLAEATLDDLVGFITVSRLKERTGLSSGAVYSAFSPSSGVGPRTRSAPQAVARRALFEPLGATDETVRRTIEGVEAALDEIESGPAELVVPAVARLLTEPGMAGARGDLAAEYNTGWLMAAVSLNDPDAADHLLASYRGFQEVYTVLLRRVLAATGREPVPGVSVGDLSVVLTTVLDGAVMRVRFDPERGEDFMRTVVVGTWAGLTRLVDDEDDRLGVRVAVPSDRPLADDEDAAVRAAVRRVADRAGWGAVTLGKVAQLSGVEESRLAARYRHRDGLATLPWNELADGLERRALLRRGSDPDTRVVDLVEDLADVACAHRALTASLLRAWLARTERLDRDDAAPSVVVRIQALLAVELRDAGWSPSRAASRSELAVGGVLLAAATSATAADIAGTVVAGLGGPGDRTAGADGQ